MSIFEQIGGEITAEMRATRQLAKVNRDFDMMLRQAQTDYNQFWQDIDGVTPTQALVAMGTNAQMFMGIAWARIQLLMTVAGLVGKSELVNVADFLPPIQLAFNPDGSFQVPE